MPYLDIVFYAVIAALLVLRLKDLLGKDTGDIEVRSQPKLITSNAEESVLDVPLKDGESRMDDALKEQLKRVRKHYSAFNTKEFLSGARSAFRMIVKAFANGDKNTLEPLLDKDMFKAFSDAIQTRQDEGHIVTLDRVKIEDVQITDITFERSRILITVRFDSEQTQTTLDKDGEPVTENEGLPEDLIDYWVFARPKTSMDPNWVLVSTYSED